MKVSKAKEFIKNWQRCDIAQLVNHFHFLGDIKGGDLQQKRIKSMEFKELSQLKSGPISSLILHMALKEEQSLNGQLSFAPELEICRSDDNVNFVSSSPLIDNDDPDSGLVPYAFKEAVMRNWLLTDASGVDDLFVAYKSKTDKNKTPEVQRLLRYIINEKINSLLFRVLTMDEVREKLNGIHLHLGADMNKANDRSEFTFTPVIELKTGKLSDETLLDIAKVGLRSSIGIAADDDDGILFEYLKPCPATCN